MTVSNQTGTYTYEYDENGNLIRETSPDADPIYTYDARNRLTSVTGVDPDGSGPLDAPLSTYGYDLSGNLTTITDPLGQTTTKTYDAQNRLIAVTAPDPDGEGPLSAPVTSYAYDLAGRLISITDPDGNETDYTYDDANRVTRITDPLGHHTDYTYDADNEVTSITDRDGRTRTFAYNDLGLKTEEDWLDSGNNIVRTISWTYDDAGNLLTASDPNSSYAFSYDLGGHVTNVDNAGTPNVPHVVLSYMYDIADNHRILMTDNWGGSVGYLYSNDRLSQLSLSTASTSARVTFGYDDIGRMTSVDRTTWLGPTQVGPTVESNYTYDLADRLTDIAHSEIAGNQTTSLAHFSYSFDVADKLTSYTGPDGTLGYNYDNLGQIVGVSGDRTESYSYDENGNRTMSGYTTGDGNQLTSDGTYDYTYDNEGNLLTKTRVSDGQETDYTWDYRNRLTEVVVKDAGNNVIRRETYTYDVFDHRIGVSIDADGDASGAAVRQSTVYDGNHPYADFDGDGNLTARYLWGTDAVDQLFAHLARPVSMAAPETVGWYLTDRLGSVREIIDAANGNVLDAIDYDSFGQILNESHPENGDRFKFALGELDTGTGLQVHWHRWYDAGTGRWVSQDPLGFTAGDTNLSRYVFNSPTNGTDPSGEIFIVLGLVMVAGAILIYPATVNTNNPQPASPVTGAAVAGATYLGVTKGPAAVRGCWAFTRGVWVRYAPVWLGGAGTQQQRIERLASSLRFSETTGRHMQVDRFVPPQVLAEAITCGQRMPDPQGAAGTIKIVHQVWISGKLRELEIIYREADNTILHYLWK